MASPAGTSRAAGAALALTAVLALTACGQQPTSGPVADVSMQDSDGLHGVGLTQPYRVPDVTLTGTSGRPYHLVRDTTKPLTLVFFGYTNCPDICQAVMADVASAMTRLGPADHARVGMLFVTTDPARDTPQVLRTYLDRFDPSFEGLTGDLPAIEKAAKAVGVAIEKGPRLPSGGYEVTHGTPVIGLDGSGRGIAVWTEGTPAQQIADDIGTLLRRGASSSGGAS